MCRKDKTNYFNQICGELELHSKKNQTKDLYKKLNELTKTRSTKYCAIEDEDGSILGEMHLVLERWRTYCAELYNSRERPVTVTWNPSEQEPDILPAEIERAIAALKCEKTPGKDGIPAELIKQLGPRGTRMITDICNNIWVTGRWPEDWTESVFIPLHKKGSTRNCENYRTIALISHASKIHVLY